MTKLLEPSFSQGYALCTPKGALLGHSYRATADAAISAVFNNEEHREEFWKAAQTEGWTVQFVYARIFTPVYFASQVLPQEDAA